MKGEPMGSVGFAKYRYARFIKRKKKGGRNYST